MGAFGKAMAITIGILIGGGTTFYWRENYLLEDSKKRKYELEEELKTLTKSRMELERTQHKLNK